MLQQKAVEKGCSSGRDLQYSSACQAPRQTARDRFPAEGNCSQWVTGRLNKTQEETCGGAIGSERDFLPSKQLPKGG